MSKLSRSRRRFLRHAAAVIAAGPAVLRSVSPKRTASAAEPATADTLIAGKDPRLIVHSASPAEMETPLSLLAEHRITPKALLFVRNNQSLAGSNTTEPARDDDWAIEISGLVSRPATIKLRELAAIAHQEVELVLQCSGNGRAMMSRVAPAKGAQWQCGAMGNVLFAGVPLARLCEHLKIDPLPQAHFLTATGKDAPAKAGEADFEHSIPLADALQRSLIALSMNGEPIPAVHGGPVRLVTPGYYATMNVKWLSGLRFEEHETANYHQVRRYRTPKEPLKPGSEFTCDLENSEANWRMRTKSVVFAPLEGQRLPAGPVAVRGVAWNDGSARIASVLVAAGDGAVWRPAQLEPLHNPYAWQHWSVTLELPPGEHQIMARAADAGGNAQPLSVVSQWNPAGYACSAVQTVRVVVE